MIVGDENADQWSLTFVGATAEDLYGLPRERQLDCRCQLSLCCEVSAQAV